MTLELAVVLALCAAGLALLLASVALFRAYVPPQQRVVGELVQRVADLEYLLENFGKRLNKRASTENMDKARSAAEERKSRRDSIEEHAVAVLAQQQQQPQSVLPLDRAALRRQVSLASENR